VLDTPASDGIEPYYDVHAVVNELIARFEAWYDNIQLFYYLETLSGSMMGTTVAAVPLPACSEEAL